MRIAIDGGEYQPLSEYLNGPSALTFVQGDISAVAKALRDFSRNNPLLVIKGGLADGSLLSPSDLSALADLPPREVLLARLAGALAAPMQQMAGLLQALPRNMAYGLSALIEQRQAGGEALPAADEAAAPAEAEAEAAPAETDAAPADTDAAPAKTDCGSPGRGGCRGGTGRARRGGRGARPRRRPPPKTHRSRVTSHPFVQPNTHKTEAKKGRPGRWQP